MERVKQVDLMLHRYRFRTTKVSEVRAFYRRGFYPLAAVIVAGLLWTVWITYLPIK